MKVSHINSEGGDSQITGIYFPQCFSIKGWGGTAIVSNGNGQKSGVKIKKKNQRREQIRTESLKLRVNK